MTHRLNLLDIMNDLEVSRESNITADKPTSLIPLLPIIAGFLIIAYEDISLAQIIFLTLVSSCRPGVTIEATRLGIALPCLIYPVQDFSWLVQKM